MTGCASTALRALALAALLAIGAESRADAPANGAEGAPPPRNQLDGRLDLTDTMGGDNQTPRYLHFTDLRGNLDATSLFGADLGLHVDLRGRKSWDDITEDRLTLREGYVTVGEDRGTYSVALGRQLIRPVASAEIDGLRLERRFGARTSAFVFGGLVPDPLDESFNYHFTGGGAGYQFRGTASNHAGGADVVFHDGDLDRLYVTQQSYLRLTTDLAAAAFVLVDLAARQGLVGLGGDRHLDLTSGYLMLRYRPLSWLDASITVNHNHTILPGRWWIDWLNQRRRDLGFVLDGQDPVGTRLTSLRGTAAFEITRELVPYVEIRGDWRHVPDPAQGFEAKAGFKWRPTWAWGDLSYAYRDRFDVRSHLASLRLGTDRTYWGAEAGAVVLRTETQAPWSASGAPNTAYDVDALLWVAIPRIFHTRQRVHLLIAYQAFIEPAITMHVGMLQLGYRF